tara:strand:+ start:486 stop:659 length:174 start_codon:yes stop_codon:yes gene_type:complete
MKEINEIIRHLEEELNNLKLDGKKFSASAVQNQLDNANKVAAKLQGAIDLFKEIEEL